MNTGICPHISLSHISRTGQSHQRDCQPCHDAVFTRCTEEYLFCGLADGQSGTRYGREGGQICLEAIADHIDSHGIENLIHAPFPDELPCILVQAYRRKLVAMARERQADLKEFASTLLAIAVERKTGKYILLHLGDGCAVSVPQTGEPALITRPDNGLTLCHTWLTTTPGAVAHFRVCFGSLGSKKRLLLLSDGATCFCRGSNLLRRAKELLKTGTPQQLQQQLEQSDPADDATCLLLDLQETATA